MDRDAATDERVTMQTILCYGDSLTWGYSAEGPSRHAYEDRWPSVLQAELGAGVHVIPFTVNDGTQASSAATVSITVTPVNDAPVAQDGSASTTRGPRRT